MSSKRENKILSANSGFTLIELLASISIIVVISGIFIINFHGADKRSELGVAKQRLASSIRMAQNNSLGSKTYDGINTPKGGWGVHFDLANPTQYIIFADKNAPNGNQTYDAGEAIEIKNLPAGVTIDSLSPANVVDIVFFPPDPITYVNGLDNATATIGLKESLNNSTALVTVNFFGLIDTQ